MLQLNLKDILDQYVYKNRISNFDIYCNQIIVQYTGETTLTRFFIEYFLTPETVCKTIQDCLYHYKKCYEWLDTYFYTFSYEDIINQFQLFSTYYDYYYNCCYYTQKYSNNSVNEEEKNKILKYCNSFKKHIGKFDLFVQSVKFFYNISISYSLQSLCRDLNVDCTLGPYTQKCITFLNIKEKMIEDEMLMFRRSYNMCTGGPSNYTYSTACAYNHETYSNDQNSTTYVENNKIYKKTKKLEKYAQLKQRKSK